MSCLGIPAGAAEHVNEAVVPLEAGTPAAEAVPKEGTVFTVRLVAAAREHVCASSHTDPAVVAQALEEFLIAPVRDSLARQKAASAVLDEDARVLPA